MPFTELQRKFFNSAAARGMKGMGKLATEANTLKKAGEELPPVKKTDDEEKHSPWSSLQK